MGSDFSIRFLKAQNFYYYTIQFPWFLLLFVIITSSTTYKMVSVHIEIAKNKYRTANGLYPLTIGAPVTVHDVTVALHRPPHHGPAAAACRSSSLPGSHFTLVFRQVTLVPLQAAALELAQVRLIVRRLAIVVHTAAVHVAMVTRHVVVAVAVNAVHTRQLLVVGALTQKHRYFKLSTTNMYTNITIM